MDKPLFSEHWYRVRDLHPKLRPHLRLHRHHYRQQRWYILEDDTSTQYHRFNTHAYTVIRLMDGSRSVQQLWEEANTRLGDAAPVQDELIHLLGQLHQVDALQTDIPPDLEELFTRSERFDDERRQSRVKNPLAMRFPLLDPDAFLGRTIHLVRPLFSRVGLLLWCALLLIGLLQAGTHWDQLVATAKSEALAPSNLALLICLYPLIKLLHELGHGYATKRFGGRVHEIGVMFLVFMPVPYVDASAATAFRSKSQRIIVGAAGIMVEVLLAVLALLVWINIEPGLISRICFNIMLIGGVSTVVFNGNPLLRFDGYYVLADTIGIPNLGQRANRYIGYLTQRYLLGLSHAQSPAHTGSEKPWLVGYAIASFTYRMLIMATICLYLINTFFIVGIVLAIWAIYRQLLTPIFKQLHFLVFDSSLRHHRPRALLASAGCAALLLAVITLLPVSSLTRFEGVIWPPETTRLVAPTEGFVETMIVAAGSQVEAGQPLIQLQNLSHTGAMRIKQARLAELKAAFRNARVNDRVKTRLVQEELSALQGEIDNLQRKIDGLLVTSPVDGQFVVPQGEDMKGQYLHQGQVLGYVVNSESAVARIVVNQQDQDRIKAQLTGVDVRLAYALNDVMPGRIVQAVPQASHELPSKVLSVDGGGAFVPDPNGITALSTTESLFEYAIELPRPIEETLIGSRVYVRFDHGKETLWTQLSRRARQLFLSKLNV